VKLRGITSLRPTPGKCKARGSEATDELCRSPWLLDGHRAMNAAVSVRHHSEISFSTSGLPGQQYIDPLQGGCRHNVGHQFQSSRLRRILYDEDGKASGADRAIKLRR
jgi:hypothetical protein